MYLFFFFLNCKMTKAVRAISNTLSALETTKFNLVKIVQKLQKPLHYAWDFNIFSCINKLFLLSTIHRISYICDIHVLKSLQAGHRSYMQFFNYTTILETLGRRTYFYGIMLEYFIFIVNILQIPESCIKPLICGLEIYCPRYGSNFLICG